MGRCGAAHCWATRGGQHQESKSVMGAQSWSAAEVDDLPWAGFLKGGLRSLREIVLGHLARTRMLGLPEQFGVARLLEDVVELVYLRYPVSSLPCSRVAQLGRKIVRKWIALRKKEMDQGGNGYRRGSSRLHGAGEETAWWTAAALD